MKVLVDTSAWVDFLNGHESAVASALAELLQGQDDICTCGIVVTEVFQGLRNERGRSDIARFFRDMTFLEPSGVDAYVSGQAAIQHDLDPIFSRDLKKGESIAIPIALAVLLAVFGLSFAATIPFLQSVASGQEGEITLKILEEVILDTPRSVTREMLGKFEHWSASQA